MLIIGILAGRYLKPWINKTNERLARAQEIALIADRITDELRAQYPDKKPLEWLDIAVDRLIKACDLKDADIAKREIACQIVKKNLPIIVK